MQNMNYYYDFSGQKFNHPLSLSINSFNRQVFSRETSLEISYVLKGSYEIITEHFSYYLTEQELAIIAPDEIHMLRKQHTDSVILTIHIDFKRIPLNIIGKYENVFESTICSAKNNPKLLQSIKEEIRNLLNVILEDEADLFALNEIMMKFLSLLKKHRGSKFNQLPITSTHHENYVKAIQFIDQNYQKDIHLDDIAKALSYSISYTSRLFKRYTGLPFIKYLSYVRIRESLENLLEGKLSIEEVSLQCGMANSKAYSTVFKELYGVSPNSYRKRFLRNLLEGEDKQIRKMEFTQDQRKLLERIFKLSKNQHSLFVDSDFCVEVSDKSIVCKIGNSNQNKITTVYNNNEIIVTIDKVSIKG